MKEYYLDRLHWIFRYTSKKFWYCLAKTLCLIVGVPLYAVGFFLEMVFTFINMIFSWIPVLNVVVTFICKVFTLLFGSLFYLCILTDVKRYAAEHPRMSDEEESDEPPTDIAGADETEPAADDDKKND